MVRTFLKVYMELGSYFLFLQEQIKDIIIISAIGAAAQVRMRARSVAACLKDQIPADIPCHYSGVQGSTINC